MAKTRTTIAYSGNGRSRTSGAASWQPYTLQFLNSEKISFSASHPGWSHLGGRVDDVGGDVIIEKTIFSPSVSFVKTFYKEGPWCPANFGSAPTPTVTATGTLNARGATAIARTTPTTPAFSLSRSLGELKKDGLPAYIGSSAFKEKVRIAKSAGDEYLNVEFGWLPLVSDLRRFCYVVKNHNKILRNYVKGSERKLKRRYAFPGSSSSGTSTGLTSGDQTTNAVYKAEWNKTDTLVFSGAFRYHVPLTQQGASRLAEFESKANYLLGVRLTPELVWDLSPWTWAADWFANTGDIIHNISVLGHDGLALQYGYIASKSVVNAFTQSTLTVGGKTYNSSCSRRSSYYVRLGSSPFGFGISPAAFSNTQKAIVAALGLSKGGKWVT